MTASNVLQLQASSASGRVAAKDVCTLKPGAAISFTPGTPRALRITEGQAWVTLDDGPHGASREAAGDVFLQAGQTLWVAAGQHAVVETLGRQRLQYRWTGLAPRSAPAWWRRALGVASLPSSDGAPCCA
jgi:hypothetical protein